MSKNAQITIIHIDENNTYKQTSKQQNTKQTNKQTKNSQTVMILFSTNGVRILLQLRN